MKVFLSYRRHDSADIAGRLADRIADRFGVGSVFKDVTSLRAGANWAEAIREEVAACDVFLPVIGPRWNVGRRLEEPDDPVRLELETALSSGRVIVPILVGGAAFPERGELPDGLKTLAYYQGIRLRSEPDFSSDASRLIDAIEAIRPIRDGSSKAPARIEIDAAGLRETRVFISHSTADREWVEREVVQALESRGIKTWYSKIAVKTASHWEREIVRGLEKCDWFLLVASPNSAESEWVKDEVYWAIFHRPTKIITLIKEACNLWDFHMRIPRLQNIDFQRSCESARETLLNVFAAEE